MQRVHHVFGLLATLVLISAQTERSQVTGAAIDFNNEEGPQCGYSSCPTTDPTKINIHLVAHTHDDVGWLKTVDQYYYGQRKQIAPFGVKHILDSVIPQLALDKKRRFIYVEMAFFTRWWNEQDDTIRNLTQQLVANGQLEFINGGWCMNDEATTTYASTIDQMTLGLQFLSKTFGPQCGVPQVGWQIDPFGHSNEQASLFAQFGFDGMFFSRVDYRDKAIRAQPDKKALDLVWHGDPALPGDSGSIYTNVFHDHYEAPASFCFDVYCKDDELVENRRSHEYNIDERIATFASYIERHINGKRTNHILIPMGGDFEFVAAGINFKNIDKLIKHLNRMRPDMNAFYSTPSCYQAALNAEGQSKSIQWPDKVDDFFPYASDEHTYWAGYFTSRPSVKLFERQAYNLLQTARLVSLASNVQLTLHNHTTHNLVPIDDDQPLHRVSDDLMQRDQNDCLSALWEMVGDLQHHDAVTGTEKQHVTSDYMRRTDEAIVNCVEMLGHGRKRIEFTQSTNNKLEEASDKQTMDQLNLNTRPSMNQPDFSQADSCPALNISQCELVESFLNAERNYQALQMSLYNPLAQPVHDHEIRLPCPGTCQLDSVRIENPSGKPVKIYMAPLTAGVGDIRYRTSSARQELAFRADLPASGYAKYTIKLTKGQSEQMSDNSSSTDQRWITTSVDQDQRKSLWPIRASSQQQNFGLVVNVNTGMIEQLVTNSAKVEVKHNMGWYLPSVEQKVRSSGAYILRPEPGEKPVVLDRPQKYKIVQVDGGKIIELHQQWNEWIWSTVRLDSCKNYIEFDYVVGPIPAKDPVNITQSEDVKVAHGREVFVRFDTDLINSGVFYTDSNGRQLIPRIRNTVKPRQVENVTIDDSKEPVASNYYPVTSTIMMRGEIGPQEHVNMAILTDRPQAGTSLSDGQLELLVHRRSLIDDNFGVDEALNEPGEDGRGLVIRGQHRMFIHWMKHYTSDNWLMQKRSDKPHFALLSDPIVNDLRVKSNEWLLKPVMIMEPVRNKAQISSNRRIRTNNISLDQTIQGVESPHNTFSLLNETLPININLLTAQLHSADQILLRFENLESPLTIHADLLPNQVYLDIMFQYKPREPGQEIKVNTSDSVPAAESEEKTIQQTAGELMDAKCKLLRGHHYQRRHGQIERHWCTSRLQEYTSQIPPVERQLCRDIFNTNGIHGVSLIDTYVDTENLFRNIKILELTEMALGANIPLSEVHRMKWHNRESSVRDSQTPGVDECDMSAKPTAVTLGPRQIRTYLAKFAII